MRNVFKVNKNKLAEWMADILPELADNEGETAWFKLFRDYDEGRTYSIVMTQRDSEDEERGNEVVAKVASIADNSGMREYDMDFEMPYDKKTGDVWDTEIPIAPVSDIIRGETSVSYVKGESDWLADQAEKIFKFIEKTHKSAELEDLQESVRRPHGRMLRESRRIFRQGRVLKERFRRDGWCAPSVAELAKGMKDGVDWLVENGSGCCHWPIYRDEERGNIWSIVMGWSEYDGGDENVYFEDGYTIRVGIRYQSERDAMQTDYDIDFMIPETDDGDAYDISYSVERNEDFRKLAQAMLAEGKSVVKEWV